MAGGGPRVFEPKGTKCRAHGEHAGVPIREVDGEQRGSVNVQPDFHTTTINNQ